MSAYSYVTALIDAEGFGRLGFDAGALLSPTASLGLSVVSVGLKKS
jgi:hypothetical protein